MAAIASVRFGLLAALSVLAAMPIAANAQGAPARAPVAPMAVTIAPPLPPEVAYGRFIALIRGHLLTGDDLVAARQWQAAAVHFGFPREEIYGIIRADLRTYQTPPFDAALNALVASVKAQSPKQYATARQKVEAALAAADAGLKAKTSDWPRFVVKVAVEVLKVAPDEYDDAVVKGRIVRPIGYQTARGVILQSDRMIESVGPAFDGDNASALVGMRADLAQLKQAFAPVIAPKEAVVESPLMQGIIGKIENAAAKLM